ILLFLGEESERVFGYRLQDYPVILVTLVLSSALILLILALNSRLTAGRVLKQVSKEHAWSLGRTRRIPWKRETGLSLIGLSTDWNRLEQPRG
ncbi:MAG: hypothetical protein QXF21_01245, partial [Thermoproteota archaeon]